MKRDFIGLLWLLVEGCAVALALVLFITFCVICCYGMAMIIRSLPI